MKSRDLLDTQPLVVRAADHLDDRQSANDADLALHERADAHLLFRNQQSRGDVVGIGAHILTPGELYQLFNLFEWRKRIHDESRV